MSRGRQLPRCLRVVWRGGTEGMPVQGWKWVLADGVSGEIGIIDQMARYTNDRKGATQ